MAGGLTIVGLGAAMTQNFPGPGGETDPEDYAGATLALGATLLVLSACSYGISWRADHEREREEQRVAKVRVAYRDAEINRHARDTARTRAWELTKQATAAAHGDDCATVSRLSGDVVRIDRNFHAAVFAKEAALQPCLSHAVEVSDSPAPAD